MTHATVRYRTPIMDNARWEHITLRPGDIVISTPPKAGTTWTQTICALLVFQTPDLPRPLDSVSPWVDATFGRTSQQLRAKLEAQRHRRILKSHTPLDGLPHHEQVTYVCVGRDPRDAAMSWDNHMSNQDLDALAALREAGADPGEEVVPLDVPERPERPEDRFWAWVDTTEPLAGLPFFLRHLASFWQVREQPNVALLHYDDLKTDLEGEMRALAARLGITIDEKVWPELVRAASFDRMRDRATEFAPDRDAWLDPQRFFHRGVSGQWRNLVTSAELPRYEAKVAQLVDPELSHWVHRGPITH